jgi:hypothetical protein
MWRVEHFTTINFATRGHPSDAQDSATCDNLEMGPVYASSGQVQMRESRCSMAESGLRAEVEGHASTSGTRHPVVETPIPFGDQNDVR